jgi:hypothetical protein
MLNAGVEVQSRPTPREPDERHPECGYREQGFLDGNCQLTISAKVGSSCDS